MNILVIGAGSIGERHARVFRQEGAEVALVEPRAARAREVAARCGCQACYGTIEEAPLQRFDAAVIATPADTHVPYGLRCAEARLPLLVEKPLAVRPADALPLLEACAGRDLTLAVAYVLRFHPVVERLRAILLEGSLGRILSVSAVAAHQLPLARPDYRNTYFANPAMGGGVVLDLSHELNYVEWLLGALEVECCTVARIPELEVETEGIAHLLLRAAGGAPVHIHLHSLDWLGRRECRVCGADGAVLADISGGRMVIQRRGGARETVEIPSERDDWFAAQARAFMDDVKHARTPRCTGSEALQTLSASAAALEAAARRAWARA